MPMPHPQLGDSGFTMAAERPSIDVAGEEFQQPSTMAIVLGALFLAGATIGAASLLLPHPAEFDSPALWSNVAIAYAVGVAVLLLRNRLPVWALQLIVLAGTVDRRPDGAAQPARVERGAGAGALSRRSRQVSALRRRPRPGSVQAIQRRARPSGG
jgi:hypothetical protein